MVGSRPTNEIGICHNHECWNDQTRSSYNAVLISKAGYTYKLCDDCKEKARTWRRRERAAHV